MLRILGTIARGLGQAAWWTVNQFAHLILHAVGSFFGTVVKGSIMAVLAKVAAVIILLGFLAAAAGAHDLAGGLITLSAVPIMLFGFVYAAKSAFVPTKKKKKKKK